MYQPKCGLWPEIVNIRNQIKYFPVMPWQQQPHQAAIQTEMKPKPNIVFTIKFCL